jgi:hypothetical protein
MPMMEDRWTPEPRCAVTDEGKVCMWLPNHDGSASGRHYDEVFGSWAEPGSLADVPVQRDRSTTDAGVNETSGSTVRP